MKKFEKGILIVGLISLVLTIIMGTITGVVATSAAVKYFNDEGIDNVKELYEYFTNEVEINTHGGRIVVNEQGKEQVTIDFSKGIHVITNEDDVNIDKNGISVKEK